MSDSVSIVVMLVHSLVVIAGAITLGRRGTPAERARRLEILRHRRRPIALVGGGILIALTGFGMTLTASLVQTVRVDLASLEAGSELEASYVVVEAFAHGDQPVCRDASSCYTPITATAQGTRVALLVKGRHAGPGHWEGFVTRSNDLSFRSSAERAGVEVTDDFARILPESKHARARAGSWVALAGIVVFAAGLVWLRRRP